MKKIISLILSAAMLATLCSCSKAPNDENYLGGKGEISGELGVLYDDTYIYFVTDNILKKFNKQTKTLTIACQVPGCEHNAKNPECKANLNFGSYYVFNGDLIKRINETIEDPTNLDGTQFIQGYIYLCDGNKQLFKNDYPDSFTDEDRSSYTCKINMLLSLGNDFLVVLCSGFMYILDTDYNVKFTVPDMGPYSGGIYYYDNEIYYINNLYNLMKIDKETGKTSRIDINSMKITEGEIYGDKLWFSNGDQQLCTYDFKTGETQVQKQAAKAVRFILVGHYLEYLKPSYTIEDPSETHLLDLDTGEDKIWELVGDKLYIDYLHYIDGEYYSYDPHGDGKIIHYSTDLMQVLNEYALTD